MITTTNYTTTQHLDLFDKNLYILLTTSEISLYNAIFEKIKVSTYKTDNDDQSIHHKASIFDYPKIFGYNFNLPFFCNWCSVFMIFLSHFFTVLATYEQSIFCWNDLSSVSLSYFLFPSQSASRSSAVVPLVICFQEITINIWQLYLQAPALGFFNSN